MMLEKFIQTCPNKECSKRNRCTRSSEGKGCKRSLECSQKPENYEVKKKRTLFGKR